MNPENTHPAPGAAEAAAESGAAILDAIDSYLRRFVCYPSEEARVAHALWIAHTHLMDHFESTPRLAFLSPEPASGKTRAMEITEPLVARPIEAISVTTAYLLRKVSDPAGPPTILFDEVDTIFGPHAKYNEELRGAINAGHRRGAMAGRCVVRGKTIETEEFPAFCAVAMAGLGNLPDTILSRSVTIRMRPRAPQEHVEPYRRRVHRPEGIAIRDRLASWAKTFPRDGHLPEMPLGVQDRDADVWEPLIAIADVAGGNWPQNGRKAAVALVADSKKKSPSLGVRLLSDLQSVVGEREAIQTSELLRALISIEEGPWGNLKGRPLDARRLGELLRQYGVRSRDVRVAGTVRKGYYAADLYDPWKRYLSPLSRESATSATSATSAEKDLR